MQRRNFIRSTAICAVAVSTSGFIRFDGNLYVGDCETTTDILGPFYRPDSPLRSSLLIKGQPGIPVELSGQIKHSDCLTPYKKAKIELWHCSNEGVYDNKSDEYRYRGTAYSNDKGAYSFKTILPVPYDVGGGYIRPAHFHLMISAEGYQPLVTQLYFSGDNYIAKDDYASSSSAKKRILNVQSVNDGSKKVVYDVSMSDKLIVEPTTIDKLAGIYTDEKNKSNKTEFFKKNNTLWKKNDVFGVNLDYIGNNTFQLGGLPAEKTPTFFFEVMDTGSAKLSISSYDNKGEKKTTVSIKEK